MTYHKNRFTGQTPGLPVTVANSANSGDPFTSLDAGSGTITYASDPAGGGRVAIDLAPGTDQCYVRDASFNSLQISLSDCFYYSAQPTGQALVHRVDVGSSSCATVGITDAGLVRLFGAGGTWLGHGNTALTPGHWYRFETQITSNATAGTVACQWYIDDGATQTDSLSASGANTNGGNITTVTRGPANPAAAGFLNHWYYTSLQAKDGTTAPLGPYPTTPETTAGLYLRSGGEWIQVTVGS